MAKPMPARKLIKKMPGKIKPASNVVRMQRTAPEDIENLDDDEPSDLAGVNKIVEGNAKRRPESAPVEPDDLIHRHGMTQTQIDNLKKRRNQYLADNVDLTMAPALMQIGAATFNEAARLFLGATQEWHEQGPDKQVAWINIGIAAIGAHCALPFKSLINAPQNGEILIYMDGGWHPASYSKGTGNKPVWIMKAGYMIPAQGKETAAYVYMDMPPKPSFAPHFDYIAQNYEPGKKREVATVKPESSERPSRITREIRSAAPAAIAGSTRDGAPRKGDYYPPPSNTRAQNIKLAKAELANMAKARPLGKAKPVKLR